MNSQDRTRIVDLFHNNSDPQKESCPHFFVHSDKVNILIGKLLHLPSDMKNGTKEIKELVQEEMQDDGKKISFELKSRKKE